MSFPASAKCASGPKVPVVLAVSAIFLLYLTHSIFRGNTTLVRPKFWQRRFCDDPATVCIFDIGHHNGIDTQSYLKIPDSRVVGVEANPLLSANARRKFAEEMQAGRLVLQHAGIAAEGANASGLYFYANKVNSQWSSFTEWRGCMGPGQKVSPAGDHTYCDKQQVNTLSCAQLVRMYGTPKVIKVDIEGMDTVCLKSLAELAGHERPTYVSKEGVTIQDIDMLDVMGYKRFKIVNQMPIRPYGSSGPYGDGAIDILKGTKWHSLEEIRKIMPLSGVFNGYYRNSRAPKVRGWFDLHASRI